MPVNNGSGERALDAGGIAEKFFASAELTVPHAKAVRVRDAILALETIRSQSLRRPCAGTDGPRSERSAQQGGKRRRQGEHPYDQVRVD